MVYYIQAGSLLACVQTSPIPLLHAENGDVCTQARSLYLLIKKKLPFALGGKGLNCCSSVVVQSRVQTLSGII